MDGPGGIAVEFKESEAFALLIAGAWLHAWSKAHPQEFEKLLAHVLPSLRLEAYVGIRQWRADLLVGNMRLWRALGLSEPLPL